MTTAIPNNSEILALVKSGMQGGGGNKSGGFSAWGKVTIGGVKFQITCNVFPRGADAESEFAREFKRAMLADNAARKAAQAGATSGDYAEFRAWKASKASKGNGHAPESAIDAGEVVSESDAKAESEAARLRSFAEAVPASAQSIGATVKAQGKRGAK